MNYYINIVVDEDTGAREDWNVFYAHNHLLIIPESEITNLTKIDQHPKVKDAIKKIKLDYIIDYFTGNYYVTDSNGDIDDNLLQEILDNEFGGRTIEEIAEMKYEYHVDVMALIE